MDKKTIKKFATDARRELMARVSQRALLYGISPAAEANPEDDVVEGRLLSSTEKRQRAVLIEAIKEKSYDQVMEEVAYTWFNRFCALRFMEVNGYLPGRVRVFTDENNAFKPQILAEAIHLEMEGLDREKVFAYKEADANDDLYKYLLITQCNALSDVLPKMFQKIADATELLFPDNLLREGSVLHQMIETIPEEDWRDAVQIIGWLYQYYNSEKKDDVFAALKKNVKITKENIPAATQLFTPDWIVRYMVENSLGRLWVEGHPNEALKSNWKYYLEEAEQEVEVQAQLTIIREEYKALKPEDILCIDPCSGSGHILAYMFDVLVEIYEAYGVDTRSAVASIVENNIYGLDIDDRAAQLSYFTVMMKACQYDKRFLRRKVQPHVYAIVESNHVDLHAVDYFCNGDAKLKKAMNTIIKELHDAKEYGSIITVSHQDWDALYARFDEIEEDIHIYREVALRELLPLVQTAQALAQKYDVVVTNPPYMGSSGMNASLQKYITKNYVKGKTDLFAIFIERCMEMTKPNGYQALVTMQSWMFISTFLNLREKILNKDIINLIRIGYNSFPELNSQVVHACSFITRNSVTNSYLSIYFDLNTGRLTDDKNVVFLNKKKHSEYYKHKNEDFESIPGKPLAFSFSDNVINIFKTQPALSEVGTTRLGMTTADNNRFTRFWFEVNVQNTIFYAASEDEVIEKKKKWVPYNKGGKYRKWYGNMDVLVNWENSGFEIKNFVDDKGHNRSTVPNTEYYFVPCATWSKISTDTIAFRYRPKGSIFDVAGACLFSNEYLTE